MKRIIKNSKDKVNAGIDGWDNRTGVIKRIDKYLYDNPEAIPPKGYIQPGSRAYDDAVSRYGDYVTTPFGNISTDDLMQYARDNKLLIDEDDIEASEAVDDIEREFQRIDRSGTDEEVAIAAIMYNLGTTMREAREILPTLSEDKIKDYVDYYYLRDLPTSERVKIWNKRKITSATNSEYALFGNVVEASQSYLDRIEELMEQGLDEETASREAYAEFYPDEYDADDYDEIYSSSNVIANDNVNNEEKVDWYALDWDEQIELMKKYKRKYKGTRIFEDFAEYIDEPVEDIIDAFSDAEYRGDIRIPERMQLDSEYRNDDIYSVSHIVNNDPSLNPEANHNRILGSKSFGEPYDPYLLDELINYYSMQDTMNLSDIWDEIVDRYDDEALANDVIESIDDSDDIYSSCDVYSSEDFNEYEDDIQEISQEFTSENTSINSTKLPAIFKMVSFEPGTTNIDYGGGRFDNVADYLTQYDVINLVYDPYNRTPEHNKEVIKTLRRAGGADTATCSNVLNVIKEPEVRKNVLENISKIVKPGGKVYITVYEGSGKGDEGPTKAGYQLNRRTADYLDEIREVFPDANRKGKLIAATNSRTVNSSTDIKASSTTSSSRYWYFTRHGVQPGSVPKYVNILDIVDTPEGTYFLADGVILTNDLRNYEIQERKPKGEIYSSKQPNSKLNRIRDKITKVVKNVMMLEAGFSEDEVEEYSAVEVDPSGKVEVRAEVDYDGLMSLCDALNPIVQRYDKDSYFEPVAPGIIEAYLQSDDISSASRNNLTSVESSSASSYNKYAKISRGNQNFSVHYNEIYNDPSADAHQMWLDFKAQVSMLRPYDDAEYAWAQIQNGEIRIIKNNKVIQTYYYLDADDMDVENVEWCDEVIDQAIYYLSKANAGIEPRIIHNSTDISAQ